MINNIKDTIENSILVSKYPVIFTGQDLSRLSGLPPFDELMLGYPIHEILSCEFYLKNQNNFMKFYKELFKWTNTSPSKIHDFLTQLNIPIITESIDGLFLKSGHKRIIELNGNLSNIICTECYYQENLSSSLEFISSKCPVCSGMIKPDIVFIGESLRHFHEASNEIYKSDLLIILGSKLNLWPANKLVSKAQKQHCKIININLY